MIPTMSIALALSLSEELRRFVQPARRSESPIEETPKLSYRSWAEVIRFPRYAPAKG